MRPGSQKVFVLSHVKAAKVRQVLSVFPANLMATDVDGREVLSVAASPVVMAAIEETIKRLDVAQPAAEMVAVKLRVLECSNGAASSAAPDDLKEVLAQLKKAFNYSDCKVGETLAARASSGSRFQITSTSRATPDKGASWYRFSGTPILDGAQSKTIQIEGLDVRDEMGKRSFTGDVRMNAGQHVILSTIGPVGEGAGVFVLSASVAE